MDDDNQSISPIDDQGMAEQLDKATQKPKQNNIIYFILIGVIILFVSVAIFAFFNLSTEKELATTTFALPTTLKTSTTNIVTTTSTTTTTTLPQFIVIEFNRFDGKLYFNIERDSFNTDKLQAPLTNGAYMFPFSEVCDNGELIYKTRLYFENITANIRNYYNIDSQMCLTGKINISS